MIIRKVHIDGFGRFRDLSIEQIPEGLTLIYGENEAGKSTLLAFLRTMLFGFPDRRSKENDYPPLNGGMHGGTVTIEANGGRPHIIERWQGAKGGSVKVQFPDGRLGDAKSLEQLLGFATRDLFRNVFAFSLSELQQFESLNDEKVKTTIYSAGMGTGRLSLPAVDQGLAKSQEELFKPSGRVSLIHRKTQELKEVRDSLKEAATHVKKFDDLHRELSAIETTIASLGKDQESTRQQRDRAGRLIDAWNDWLALCEAERESTELLQIEAFPVDGVKQLVHLEERLVDLQQRVRQKETDLRLIQEEIDSLVVDERILEQDEEINRLHRGRDQYDLVIRETPLLERDLKTSKSRITEDLLELGPDWDKDRLVAFNTSIPEQEVIRGHREALQQAENTVRDRRQRLELAEKSLAASAKAEQDTANVLKPLSEPGEKDYHVVAARLRALRDLVSQVRQQIALDEKKAHIREREEDFDAQRQRAQEQLQRADSALPLWPAMLVMVIGFALGVGLFLQGNGLFGLLIILLLGAAFPGGYFVYRRKPSTVTAEERQKTQAYLQGIEKRLNEIRQEQNNEESRQTSVKAKIAEHCKSLDIEGSLDEAAINSLIIATESAQEELRQWTIANNDWVRAAAALEEIRRGCEEATGANTSAESALSTADAEWKKWLASAGLRLDLKPDSVLAIVSMVKQCRERVKATEDLQGRIDQNAVYLDDYRKSVHQVAGNCGLTPPGSSDAGVLLDILRDRLQSARDNKRQRAKLNGDIVKIMGELEVLKDSQQQVERDRSDLLASGDTTSSQEFREREAVWNRRQELQRDIKQFEMALERIAGRGERLVAFKNDLCQMVWDEQETIKQEAEDRLPEIDRALKAALNEQGAIRQQLQDLEVKCNFGELRFREQSLLTEIQEAARRWAVYTITRGLIAEAKDRYERERQPGVIRDASGLFRQISREQYAHVLTSLEKATLHVVDRNGHTKEIQDLSRGTQEQLYLSVRLGLIREFSQRQESLPVIMDDILVNFDPYRAEASLGALLELAQTHQVLLFTCHPETCELVQRLSPVTPVYHLRDGQLVPQSHFIQLKA